MTLEHGESHRVSNKRRQCVPHVCNGNKQGSSQCSFCATAGPLAQTTQRW